MTTRLLAIACAALSLCCSQQDDEKLFEIRHGNDLGIDFQNTITTNDSLHALSFEYIYNGSGIGVGDFNNDGLEDLFFGGNQVSSKLYLNEGNLKFKDVTKTAGVQTERWVTGVSVVDINQDGLLDVFLAVAGKTTPENMRDLLFVNQGIKDGVPHFKEMAHDYGIDDEGYGTMGAFFDYDKDGDLDLYLVTNALESFNRNNLRPKRVNGEASSTDRLYRNNGNNTFTNVSREAGILIEGYGLGVNVCDLNQDNWPDLYVSNDFMSNDLIWINQRNGTFQNLAGQYLKHQTHNGMGNDVADFNNDGLQDIIVVDMLPPGHKRQKMMTAGQNYDHFHMSEQIGYQPQYMRNTLQLNRGMFEDSVVRFSEIAFMSGVSRTDWSWAPLFADFDNDGWKDLFIANGYRKDVTNLDFIFFGLQESSPFGTPQKRQEGFSKELANLNDVKLSNYFFHNTGSLRFQDKTKAWGADFPTFSNGSVYVDLEKDGDLDLVTNNIDQEVIIYENQANKKQPGYHYITLESDDHSFGQKIFVYTGASFQFQEVTPYRGFQSSVSTRTHFGLGERTQVDSIRIQWTDGTVTTLRNIPLDSLIRYKKEVNSVITPARALAAGVSFEKVSFPFVHKETSPPDIKITRTLLHELSRFGPCLTVGDITGDQLEDVIVGGERGQALRAFLQDANGFFHSKVISSDSTREDGDVMLFDADRDNDLDLYVGGSCPSSMEEPSPHLLYINDGRGKLTLVDDALPKINVSTSCVAHADIDADGDEDLFVAGRMEKGKYPLPTPAFLLRNDSGKFVDITAKANSALTSMGVVTDALFTDINRDQKPDLVVVGEWMPVRIFENNGAAFQETTHDLGLTAYTGWWSCVEAADLNNDGFPELVVGNQGTNSFFEPTAKKPVKLYAKDFDKNASVDPIVTYYNPVEQDEFIVHNRMVLIDQIPSIKRRFEKFEQYSETPFSKALSRAELEGATVLEATTLESILLINEQGKSLKRQALPEAVQMSGMNGVAIEDVNFDKHLDLVIVGNNYSQETLFGRYDASLGNILLGDGNFQWKSVEPRESRLVADGDAKSIEVIHTQNGKAFIIANNNAAVSFFVLKAAPTQITRLP